METIKDLAMLTLFVLIIVLLSPILIPMFILDDMEGDPAKMTKAEYYQRYQ